MDPQSIRFLLWCFGIGALFKTAVIVWRGKIRDSANFKLLATHRENRGGFWFAVVLTTLLGLLAMYATRYFPDPK
jgi:hypothetical protein